MLFEMLLRFYTDKKRSFKRKANEELETKTVFIYDGIGKNSRNNDLHLPNHDGQSVPPRCVRVELDT